MIRVDGKQIAETIKANIRMYENTIGNKTLAIFYVGAHPVIESYVALKKRVGAELGISVDVLRFAESVSEASLIDEIQRASRTYSGIIVQLPLPESLNKENILNAVPSACDVDVLSSAAYEQFVRGQTQKLPPVVAAIKEIVDAYGIVLAHKRIVIVGKGLLVGKPIAAWLDREGYSYEMIDREHVEGLSRLKDADIIISGTGVSSLIQPSMIKDGVVLFDAGTSTASGKLMGDIDPACYEKASIVSGVPGGIGPLTVVSLLRNLFLP